MTAFQRAGAGWPSLQPKHWLCGTVTINFTFQKESQLFHCMIYMIISYRFSDVLAQCRELDTWTQDFVFPAVVWISGLFSPQSFLTGKTHEHILNKTCCHCTETFCFAAILQSIARKNKWPLDRMSLCVDVTKKTKDDYGHPPREGAYIHGLFIEGEHNLHSSVNVLFVWMNVTQLSSCRCSLG